MNQERRGALSRLLRNRRFVPAVAVLGLLIRLALIYAARHNEVFADELDYEKLGISLWTRHTYALAAISAFRPPAEPFLIAGVYGVFGQHPLMVKLVEALLLTALPFLCARLARALGLGVGAASLSAAVASLHPALAYTATTLYPTALTAVALTAGVVYCVEALQRDKAMDGAKGGLALGVAAASTTTFGPLPVLIAVCCLLKKKMRVAVAIVLLGMLPTAAWLVRNRVAMGSWVIATNGGMNLVLGANDLATPRSGNLIQMPLAPPPGEMAANKAEEEFAVAWIKLHPVKYGELCLERAVLVVDSVGKPATRGMHDGVAARVVGWLMLPVVLAGLVGLFLYWRSPASWFTGLALALVIVSSALTIVKPRFRFPCDPLLGVFAVATVASAWKRFAPDNDVFD